MGFQNTTPLEMSIDNMDILYQAATRWMQLTYNHRNLVGDGCTERTNAGISDYGIEVVERMNELGILISYSLPQSISNCTLLNNHLFKNVSLKKELS